MKKFYSLLVAAVMVTATAFQSFACHNSSFTLNSHTDLGGGLHQYTVTFCAGSGPNGAVGQTGLWGVMLGGGATFHTYPATLTSPNTQAVYGADNASYGPELLVYDAISWPSNSPYYFPNAWTCLEGNCGAAGATCVTFTYVTNGAPTSMTLMGAEAAGVGVPPYGCNGQPDMVINLSGPVVDAGSPKANCLGGCATLNATVSGGTAPYTYLWQSQYNVATVGTTANVSVCPTENELYLLTVTDANGLSSSDYVSVTVYQPPVVSAGADKLIYRGYGASCASLSGSANGSMGPYTYSWSNGSSASSITVCPIATTNYTLTVTDAHGCVKTDVATVTVRDIRCGNNKVRLCRNGVTSCVQTSQVPSKLNQGWALGACGSFKLDGSGEEDEAITEDEAAIGTSIFPNPAAHNVTLQYGYDVDAAVTIEVFDMAGRMVQTVVSNGPVLAGEVSTTTFSVSDLRSGLYMVAITSSNGERATHRLMVSH
jgi:hypothetical protein